MPEAQRSANIPTDITFSIVKSVVPEEKDAVVNKISAHKYILALASPVFKTLFYGNYWFEVPDVIEITNTSVESFQTMIDFIYQRQIYVNIKTKEEIQELHLL